MPDQTDDRPRGEPDGDTERRILAAARAVFIRRGTAGARMQEIAEEAGVNQALLHYYFGSKERLLVEVVRDDCDQRLAALDEALAQAGSVDEIVRALVESLEAFVEGEPGSQAVLYEMLSASRHSEEIRAELAELYRRWRAAVADALREKERAGLIEPRGEPEAIASMLFALGDGVIIQMLADPDWDSSGTLEMGQRTARFLLGGEL